jgi:iron complex outermembrane receptor protein
MDSGPPGTGRRGRLADVVRVASITSVASIAALAMAAGDAQAQARAAELGTQAQARAAELGTVEVIDTAPLPGTVTPRDSVPTNVQSATSAEIADERAPTIGEFMNRRFGGVFINEAQSNAYQPDVQYRGFVASPLLGNPIGLSVFIDGVRVNESFGDTVLWDLIPQAAIESVNLIPGSNPVYGLNTLGGALTLRTKSGRTSPGISATATIGSHGRRELEATYGAASGPLDAFLSVERLKDDGWRDRSPSDVRRVFGKLGWSPNALTDISLSMTHADNELAGNGLVPESIYAERRKAVYTYPDVTEPRLSFLKLAATHQLDDAWTLSGNVYYRRLKIRTLNGDAEFDDGGTPGVPGDDGYEGEMRSTRSTQTTTGIGLQLARDGRFAGLRNRLAIGANLDHGKTRFRQSEQDGVFTPDRGVEPDGDIELDTDVIGRNRYRSLYLTDVVSVTDAIDVTVSARYMTARVSVGDQTGEQEALNGSHRFSRWTPAIGATWRLQPGLTVYGGYSEGFRVPTAVELTCADPEAPCSLPVAFVADPPLKAVVVKTFEAGLRGRSGTAFQWNAGLFRSNLRDDILFTSLAAGQGFFANVPQTRRQGIELGIGSLPGGRLDWFTNYGYTRATYEADVELFNGVANESDPATPETTTARSGNRLPGVPSHLFKAGLRWKFDDRFSLGTIANVVGNQYLRGDEGNAQRKLGGYSVFHLLADYRVTNEWRVFGRINNVFDRNYATLGAYNRVAFDAASAPLEGVGPGPVNRFVSPGMPRAFWLGVEYRPGASRYR